MPHLSSELMDTSASPGSPHLRVRSQPQPALDPVWIEAAASSSRLCRRASPPSSFSPWRLSPAPRRATLLGKPRRPRSVPLSVSSLELSLPPMLLSLPALNSLFSLPEEQETNARRTAAAPSMEIVAASCAVIRPMPGAGALWPDPRPRSPAGLIVGDHLQVCYPIAALLPLLVGDNERVLCLLAPSAWATRSAMPKHSASLVGPARLQPSQASPQPRKEYRKRSVCEDSFNYVGSSFSRIRSSSKRDLSCRYS